MFTIALGAFGSIIGSFLNVVVYRVPLGRSVVSPASACGNCGSPVRWYDNIPVISWVVLRGRCRDCSSAIALRYPLVELGAGLFFVVVALRFVPALMQRSEALRVTASIVELIAFLYLAAISLALALIDIDTHRLPNMIVLPAYPVGVVLLGTTAALNGEWGRLVMAAAGLLIMGGAYSLLAVGARGGMGLGDVKLAGALGLFLGWLGWDALAVGALGGFILGGLFGVVLLASGRSRRTAVAFGPWMLAGAWLGILAAKPIADTYLALLGLA